MHKNHQDDIADTIPDEKKTSPWNKKDLQQLPVTLLKKNISNSLSIKEVSLFARTTKRYHKLFQPILNEAKANATLPLLTAVVQGNLTELVPLIKANPALLFAKGRVTDPSGQTFYDVSSYQLMTFLCDDDMKAAIMPLIPHALEEIRWKQYTEIGGGGSDLIKMDRDPALLAFEEVTLFIEKNQKGEDRRYSLLENQDGIIFYKDEGTGNEYLYYANQEMNTIELIQAKADSQPEQMALDAFKASFSDMEMNSGRRSNNNEHQLIASTMQRMLHRTGIQYERDGNYYCDSRIEFGLINAYRKFIRLANEKRFVESGECYCREVGREQRRVMWLLQRICEVYRLFYPLSHYKTAYKKTVFLREFKTSTLNPWTVQSVCVEGCLAPDLGLNFAISKGTCWLAVSCGINDVEWVRWGAEADLLAVCWLIENAKENVLESMPQKYQSMHHVSADLRRGP